RHVTEEQVCVRPLPTAEGDGDGTITFGTFLDTRTAAIGMLKLEADTEKTMSVNNDHDMNCNHLSYFMRSGMGTSLIVTEQQVQFRPLPTEEGDGDGSITFGNFFNTGKAAVGVLKLEPDSEKAMSVNNDHTLVTTAHTTSYC
ncbi:hypothetical protein MTO96_044032, partial [Rhipicephalus appendiculatus]